MFHKWHIVQQTTFDYKQNFTLAGNNQQQQQLGEVGDFSQMLHQRCSKVVLQEQVW